MRTVAFLFFILTISTLTTQGQTDERRRASATRRVFPKANHPAEFPGGSQELSKYLAKRLRYPSSLLKSGIFPPLIKVSFVVAETGAVEDVEVIELREEEYMRLEPYLVKVVNAMEKMPHWKPATIGNIAVASRHLIPVSIDLK